jgi:hypothetical protein
MLIRAASGAFTLKLVPLDADPVSLPAHNSMNSGESIHELLSLHHAKKISHPDQSLPARPGAIPEDVGD